MLSDFLYRNRTALSLFFTISFSLFSMIWNGNSLSRSLVGVKNLSLSVSSSLSDFKKWFGGLWTSLEDYQKIVEERNAYLKELKENDILYSKYLSLKQQNKLLREELNYKPRTEYKTVKARVLSVRLSTIYKTIIINKGSNHGIEPYMPVITKVLFKSVNPKTGKIKRYRIQALVGKIISVDDDSSIIQPLINSNFKCGVRVPGTGLWATLDGNSDRILQPRLLYISSLVSIDNQKLQRPLVTSGKGGIFPPGIPIGRIVGVNPDAPGKIHISGSGYKSAYVQPFAKLESLESVVVLLKKPDAWAKHWPAGKKINPQLPNLGDKTVKPSTDSEELPGTSKFMAFVPKKLVEKTKKKLEKKAKKNKKYTGKKKKKKKKKTPVTNDEEFEDLYNEEEPDFVPENGGTPKPVKEKKPENKTDEKVKSPQKQKTKNSTNENLLKEETP